MNLEAILDILFPPECLGCGKGLIAGALCAACRWAARGAPALALRDTGTCVRYYFLGAAGHYKNHVLKSLIHALKFGGIRNAAFPLAEILAYHARTVALPLKTFSVMPIPLSKARLRERGFNQSELIAKHFADMLALPFEKETLIRRQHRKPQSRTKTIAERIENIRGCFAINSNAALTKKNIILVDDVSTSGATFLEASTALIAAGAETILALAVAKA